MGERRTRNVAAQTLASLSSTATAAWMLTPPTSARAVVLAGLFDAGFQGQMTRVTSLDQRQTMLLGEDQIEAAGETCGCGI